MVYLIGTANREVLADGHHKENQATFVARRTVSDQVIDIVICGHLRGGGGHIEERVGDEGNVDEEIVIRGGNRGKED